MNYYNSHGYTMQPADFIELEIEERGNYTLDEFLAWQDKYGFADDAKLIWVTANPLMALSYETDAESKDDVDAGMSAEEFEEKWGVSVSDLAEFDETAGTIITESNDGDGGFLFVLHNKAMGDILDSEGRTHFIYKAMQCTDLNDCILNINHVKKLIADREKAGRGNRDLYRRLFALQKRQEHFFNKETKHNPMIREQVRSEVAAALEKVTQANSPEVWQRIQTPTGYAAMEERVILSMIATGLTPAGIIPQLEQEFSGD